MLNAHLSGVDRTILKSAPQTVLHDSQNGAIEARQTSAWLWIGLNLAILGAVLLPLVPIWSAAYTLLAAGWLWQTSPTVRTRLLFGLGTGTLGVAYLLGWANKAIASPIDHLVNGFIYVFGVPVGLWPSAAQLALQIVLVVMLAARLWPRARRFERVFISANVAFALWSALSAAVAISAGRAAEPDAVLIAASVWANWACLGLLVTALVTTKAALRQLLGTFVVAGMVLACGMAVQLAIGDYSYVLTSANTADFFERVRGTYYYHAPPVQMLAVALPLAFSLLVASARMRVLGIAVVLTISAVILFNSTRGISLSLAVGLAGFAILVIVSQRRVQMAILPLLLLAALLSQVFYVKPGTIPSDPVISSSAPVAVAPVTTTSAVATESVDAFISSNNARSGLAEAGIKALTERPFTGSGPGNAQIEVGQNEPMETSSHVLGLDMATMLGIPGLLFFLAALGLPAVRLAIGLLINRKYGDVVLGTSLVASISVFAMSSMFHPQERSEIIALAFLLSGLAMTTLRMRGRPQDQTIDETRVWDWRFRTGVVFMVMGFVACLVVTSPSYVFPALEFIARYRQPLAENPDEVVTNSPLLGAAVSAGLALAGVQTDVRVMTDDPSELALNHGYVLWSPSSEKAYPNLRKAAGIVSHARYGQWMGINIPRNWWMLANFQPNIQFLKAGRASGIPIAVDGLVAVPIAAGQSLAFSPQFSPASQPATVDVTLTGPDGNTALLHQGENSSVVNYNQVATVALNSGTEPNLTLSALTADAVLTVTSQPALLPSVAQELRVRLWVDGVERDQYESNHLNDTADRGGIKWSARSTTTIELSGESTTFAAYRFKPMTNGRQLQPLPRAWTIEAALPNGDWVTIDRRDLATEPSPDTGYFVASPNSFSLVRIVFTPDTTADYPTFVGLGEIELFPMPSLSAP